LSHLFLSRYFCRTSSYHVTFAAPLPITLLFTFLPRGKILLRILFNDARRKQGMHTCWKEFIWVS
jgi:hypothetical protein